MYCSRRMNEEIFACCIASATGLLQLQQQQQQQQRSKSSDLVHPLFIHLVIYSTLTSFVASIASSYMSQVYVTTLRLATHLGLLSKAVALASLLSIAASLHLQLGPCTAVVLYAPCLIPLCSLLREASAHLHSPTDSTLNEDEDIDLEDPRGPVLADSDLPLPTQPPPREPETGVLYHSRCCCYAGERGQEWCYLGQQPTVHMSEHRNRINTEEPYDPGRSAVHRTRASW